jgi:hypothetical protein
VSGHPALPPYQIGPNAESALLAHLMPGVADCAQINHSGVLPRGTTAFGFWHPRRRWDQNYQGAGRAFLGCGFAVGPVL